MQKLNNKTPANCETQLFFEELANYYWHENDLSNITVALCNSSPIFRELFIYFFFPQLNINDVKGIVREVRDLKGMGCRVDIHIPMKSGELYIIEVKINDRNHHFDTYRDAYNVDNTHFGYITNYYCPEGIEHGLDIKTWEELYLHLSDTLDSESPNSMMTAYLEYLKRVCNIKIFSNLMNFKSLKTIPQFFQLFDRIISKISKSSNIQILSDHSFSLEFSYKCFNIKNTANTEILLKAYVMLFYSDSDIISIGIPSCKYLNIEEITTNAKKIGYRYSKDPYIDKEWWGYLWYSLSDDKINELDGASTIEQQEEIIENFLKEVIKSIRLYEKPKIS